MAERPDETHEFFRGALILSAAAILVKILSAAYRIPFQNIAGDIGFYIYQQVYPFYGVMLTISTIGFPVVISKLIAEQDSAKKGYTVQDILRTSSIILGALGIILFTGLFLGARWIAGIMGDPQLAGLLKIVAFSYLLMPFSSVLRGYFQGFNDMMPTASSQIGEQSIRVMTILFLSTLFVYKESSLYTVGEGAVFGSVTGGLASLFLLGVSLFRRGGWRKNAWASGTRLNVRKFTRLSKTLIMEGIAFCITGLMLILFQFVDSLHLYSLLKETGLNEVDAKVWKGVYDRGQPLVQLGNVVANSFALALVPVIAGLAREKQEIFMLENIQLSIRVSAAIGIAAAAGLAVTMKPLNYMLYTDTKGTFALAVFSLSVFFTSLIMAKAAVLQSLGYSLLPVTLTFLGVGCKWLFDLVLVPAYRINGAALSTVLAFSVMALLFHIALKKRLGKPIYEKRKWLIILLATVGMVAAVMGLNLVFQTFTTEGTRWLAAIQALTGAGLGAAVYLTIVLRFELFSKEELALIPGGNKVQSLLLKKRSA